jgi:membrane-associated phospholipid phosphatase
MINNVATVQNSNRPENIPVSNRIWKLCLLTGGVLWGIGIILWFEQGIDEKVLTFFDAARVAHGPSIIFQEWLTSYGMAVISGIYVIYLLVSQVSQRLNAPKTIYLYAICSLVTSGIFGDILKEVLARHRPLITYGNDIFVLSQSITPSMPSGHATKSVALTIPFILLVSNTNNLHRVIKVIMILVAGGVCFSRIVLGAHYVSDVIAGAGIGIMGFPFTMMFANMILKQTKTEQLPILSKVCGVLLVLLTIVFILW